MLVIDPTRDIEGERILKEIETRLQVAKNDFNAKKRIFHNLLR